MIISGNKQTVNKSIDSIKNFFVEADPDNSNAFISIANIDLKAFRYDSGFR
jgi:hypothetical protein